MHLRNGLKHLNWQVLIIFNGVMAIGTKQNNVSGHLLGITFDQFYSKLVLVLVLQLPHLGLLLNTCTF